MITPIANPNDRVACPCGWEGTASQAIAVQNDVVRCPGRWDTWRCGKPVYRVMTTQVYTPPTAVVPSENLMPTMPQYPAVWAFENDKVPG